MRRTQCYLSLVLENDNNNERDTNMTTNTTTTLTENERNLLIEIVKSEYQDAAVIEDTVDHQIWLQYIDGFANKAKFGGVMASAKAKGLADSWTAGRDRADWTIWITAAGAAALKASGFDFEAMTTERGW